MGMGRQVRRDVQQAYTTWDVREVPGDVSLCGELFGCGLYGSLVLGGMGGQVRWGLQQAHTLGTCVMCCGTCLFVVSVDSICG